MKVVVWALLMLISLPLWAADEVASTKTPKNLDQLLMAVKTSNHKLLAQSFQLKAQEEEASVITAPAQPMVGLLNQKMAVESQYLTLSQSFLFPLKYIYAKRVEDEKVDREQWQLAKLEASLLSEAKLRYFQNYIYAQLLDLDQAHINTLLEFARAAESKYASGEASQADAMQAHVLITELEVEKITLEARLEKTRAQLQTLAGGTASNWTPAKKLETPELQKLPESLNQWLAQSIELKVASAEVKVAERQKKLALLSWTPDFQFGVQKQISGELNEAQMISVGMSIPLWFWGPAAQVRKASHQLQKQEQLRSQAELEIKAQINTLFAELKATQKILKISESSLIPQAETGFRVAAAAYRTGRRSFTDFLSSETVYFEVRKKYFQSLESYINRLTIAEALIGEPLADWNLSSASLNEGGL